MDINPFIASDKNVIQSYGKNVFTVNGREYFGSHVVTPDRVYPLLNFDYNNHRCFEEMLREQDHDIVLVGTGEKHLMPTPEVKEYLATCSFSVDFMSTGAACRTYNVLLHEDRKVLAILTAL